MKNSHIAKLILLATAQISFSQVYAAELQVTVNILTKTRFQDRRLNRHVTVQVPSFQRVPDLRPEIVNKINAQLRRAGDQLTEQASDCLSAEPGDRWNYSAKYEKAVRATNHLSVIFSKNAICAGVPNIDKEVFVYSTLNGKYVSAKMLFKSIFPKAENFYTDLSTHLVRLDDEMVDRLIKDSADILTNFDMRCINYLRFSAYRIWPDAASVVFYPEFNQGNSGCQREYVIRLIP